MAGTNSSRNGNGAHHIRVPAAPITDTEKPTQRPPRNMAAVTARLRTSAEPVRRNVFTGAIEYYQEQRWRPLRDADLRSIAERLQNDGLPETTLSTVRDAMALLADAQPHHPVRDDCFGRLPPWDGTKRYHRLLTHYLTRELHQPTVPFDGGDPDGPPLMSPRQAALRYYEILGQRWMLGCVARVMNPGCPIDMIPVLTGNLFHLTKAIETLVPRPWLRQVTALPPDISWDEGAQRILGAWVNLLPPFRHNPRELQKLKAFLSAGSDRTQRGMLLDRAPRQCAFIGLHDEYDRIDKTGTPLFWPAVVERIDRDALKADQPQLWAEAVAAYSRGETWLRPSEMNVLASAGQTALCDDDLRIRQKIEDWLATRPEPYAPFSLDELIKGAVRWYRYTSPDPLPALPDMVYSGPVFEPGKGTEMTLASVLKAMGFERRRCWSGSRRGEPLWRLVMWPMLRT
jgi:hypothetical protein